MERSIWNNKGTVIIESNANLNQGFRLANSGLIKFGENFRLSANSTIICDNEISFGKGCLISWDCLIMDSDQHNIYSIDNTIGESINKPKKIIIGDGVWIGCRSTILKGSTICNNCIIAAGTVFTSCAEIENCIYGSHGKVLKENVIWKF